MNNINSVSVFSGEAQLLDFERPDNIIVTNLDQTHKVLPVGFPRNNGHRIYVIHYLVCLIFEVKRALII